VVALSVVAPTVHTPSVADSKVTAKVVGKLSEVLSDVADTVSVDVREATLPGCVKSIRCAEPIRTSTSTLGAAAKVVVPPSNVPLAEGAEKTRKQLPVFDVFAVSVKFGEVPETVHKSVVRLVAVTAMPVSLLVPLATDLATKASVCAGVASSSALTSPVTSMLWAAYTNMFCVVVAEL
jgi:hypothetical protein